MQRPHNGSGPRGPYFILAAGVVLGILALTLSPAEGARIASRVCVLCGERGLANIIGNVLLFLPLGVLLAMGRAAPLRVLLLGALLSAGIELIQHWVPGRNPNPVDILFNTIGAGSGVLLVRTSRWWLHARGAVRIRLGAMALIAAVGTVMATGWLLGPGYPEASYFGQWTPEPERVPGHPGRVLEARIGSMPIPSTRLEHGARVRESLRAGESLTLHAVVGPSTAESWPIFRVAAGRGTLVVSVSRKWDDLLVRLHTRASVVRLTPPEIRVRGVFAGVPANDPVWIRVWGEEAGGYCVEVDGSGTCGHGFTAGRAWALLHGAGPLPQPLWKVLDAGLLVVLMLPVGFWWRRTPEVVLAMAIVTVALLLTPVFTALRPTPITEIAAALVGLLVGAGVGRSDLADAPEGGKGLARRAVAGDPNPT